MRTRWRGAIVAHRHPAVTLSGTMPRLPGSAIVLEDSLSLSAAAARYGVPVVRLRRWCATGKLRCEREGDGWLIPISQATRIEELARAYGTTRAPVRALAVPAPAVPPDLANTVATRLGLSVSAVTLTPLALDGVEYVVAVWRGDVQGSGGLPELHELAVELHAELLDGEIRAD